MQLQITRKLFGSIDGIALDRFQVGQTYDVGPQIGACLLAMGAAIPVIDGRPIASIPRTGPARKQAGAASQPRKSKRR